MPHLRDTLHVATSIVFVFPGSLELLWFRQNLLTDTLIFIRINFLLYHVEGISMVALSGSLKLREMSTAIESIGRLLKLVSLGSVLLSFVERDMRLLHPLSQNYNFRLHHLVIQFTVCWLRE